jgi:hypothetical protein
MQMTGNRDQSSRRASVSVTFDNLGEAAEIQLGIFGADQPRGEHFSVLEVLPRVLELLESLHLRGTFFVEGLNAETYPEALRSIAAAGHEVAAHAWCHEPWAGLGADREADLLARTTTAMNEIGIRPRGFRPPGGVVTEHTAPLLLEQGYSYHSPAGRREGVAEGLAVLPFRWRLVDAYYYMPQFGELRQRHGDDAEPLTPQDMRGAMLAALDSHPQSGGHLALLFHPFLAGLSDECFIAMRDVLERVQQLAVEGCCEVTRMDETAGELLSEPARDAPELDASTWM